MRDTSRPVPFLTASRAIFNLALEGMVWSRRSVAMALLLGLPVAFGIVFRAVLIAHMPARMTGAALFGEVVVGYYLSAALPLAALFYATALLADEVEGKTITYLLTRPIERSAILSGKFAAYLVTTASLTLPPAVVTFFLLLTSRGTETLAASVPDLFRDAGVLLLALLAYGALFTLVGVLLRRPTIPGLLFIFVWEAFASRLPGYTPRLTFAAHLRSLVSHRPAETGLGGLFLQVLPTGESLGVLIGAALVFLAAAVWIFSAREYVLEQ